MAGSRHDRRMSPPGRRELGSDDRCIRGSAGVAFRQGWNDFGFVLFLFVLFIAAVGGTIGLRWEAFLVWPVWCGLLVFAGRRWRDRAAQNAWLEGAVLSVQTGRRVRQCDLATTRRARLGSNVTARGDPGFLVLNVQDATTGIKLRYVLRTAGGHPLPADDLRVLAEAFELGTPSSSAHSMAARLREIAQYGRELGSSERIDWSHRTGH